MLHFRYLWSLTNTVGNDFLPKNIVFCPQNYSPLHRPNPVCCQEAFSPYGIFLLKSWMTTQGNLRLKVKPPSKQFQLSQNWPFFEILNKKSLKFCVFGKSQFHQIQPKYGLWNEQCITCICRVEVTTMAAQQDQELECLHGGPPRPPWLR